MIIPLDAKQSRGTKSRQGLTKPKTRKKHKNNINYINLHQSETPFGDNSKPLTGFKYSLYHPSRNPSTPCLPQPASYPSPSILHSQSKDSLDSDALPRHPLYAHQNDDLQEPELARRSGYNEPDLWQRESDNPTWDRTTDEQSVDWHTQLERPTLIGGTKNVDFNKQVRFGNKEFHQQE